MDIRVQELLEKIKKEGVENAQAASASILKETEAERARILAQASKEAAAIIQKAQAEAARFEESSKAALNQASRDLLLAFRGELEKTLATVVRTETAAA
ncbi:MAG TPA: V-type ATP synthase subunit E, partial [Spirochaetales bacterium]|nr:V-type ATP synthase subunit E [Spirochaetales bacterium]